MDNRLRRRDLLKLAAATGTVAVLPACITQPGETTPSGTLAPSESLGAVGKYPLGKFEGGEVILDAAKFPKTFKEAPELATLVQQGKLPKVADRIGQDPLVIKPVHGIGKYGGTIRKGFIGTADGTAFRFANGPDSLLYFDWQWTKVVPNIARSFELSADGKILTIQLRRGMKWSDGQPFTTDDVMFWYRDMYLVEDISGGPSAELQINGEDVKIEQIDQYTFRFVSPVANYLLPERLVVGGDIGGPAPGGSVGMGLYAPKHYLSKFHPKYVGQAAVEKLAADAKFKSWTEFFLNQNYWLLNVDLPVLTPWKTTRPMNDPSLFVMERNPYSIWVDTDGNQLPYVGTISHSFAQDPEAIALHIIAGDYDFMDRYLTVDKLPVYIDSQQKGNYKVSLDPEQGGLGIALNLAYEADPEIGDLIRNVDFRRALSMGLDRGQINESFFLGLGTVSAPVPADINKYFPGKEYRTKWATLDLAQANSLLDKIGYTAKDADGFRARKDGKGHVTLTFTAVNRLANFPQMAEMIKQQWKKIGIDLQIEAIASSLAQQKVQANTAQMVGNLTATDDVFLSPAYIVPGGPGYSAIMGRPFAQWQNSGGKNGKEPFPALKEHMALWNKGYASPEKERIAIGKQLHATFVDQVFAIGLVVQGLQSYGIRIAKNNLENVPGRFLNSQTFIPTVNALPQTFYFK